MKPAKPPRGKEEKKEEAVDESLPCPPSLEGRYIKSPMLDWEEVEEAARRIQKATDLQMRSYFNLNSVTLTLPPSLNHMYTTNRHTGQRVLKKEGKNWLAEAKTRIREVCPSTCDQLTAIHVFIYFPDRRVRDTSNYTKLLLDALKGVVVKDDRWTMVGEEHYYPRLSRENPRIEVYWE